jgi:selenocysteine lyase/cysteine desulfurase
VDYVAFSGHKTYAPFGAGALVGRRDWLDSGAAYLAGGGAVHEVTVATTTWASAPHRHEGGSPNVLGAVALAAACDALAGLPAGALEAHERALRERLTEGLAALPGVRVLRIWADSAEPTGVVGFTVGGADPGLVAAYLSAEHGIGVRDGRFCAHPLLDRLGIPGGALRASVGVGSSFGDVDRLVAAVAAFLSEGPRVRYELVSGRWQPVDDPRPLAGLGRIDPAAVARGAGCGPAAA